VNANGRFEYPATRSNDDCCAVKARKSATADAETDRTDNDHRRQRRAQQAAQADAQVLNEIFDQQPALHRRVLSFVLLTAVLARARQIAELTFRLVARLIARETARDEIVGPHLEMQPQLFVDV